MLADDKAPFRWKEDPPHHTVFRVIYKSPENPKPKDHAAPSIHKSSDGDSVDVAVAGLRFAWKGYICAEAMVC